MSQSEFADRMLASHAQVRLSRLREGSIDRDERKRIVKSSGIMASAPLWILDDPDMTVTRLAAHARRMKRKHKLGLICVDYLTLLVPEDVREHREQQVSRISRGLKRLAKSVNVPVITAAQLNRQVEAGYNRPKLSHLRESGAIEQDADVVLFVHRAEYYRLDDEDLRGKAEIMIAKQRNGPTGVVDLVWRREFTRFDEKCPDRIATFDDWNQSKSEEFPP